MTPRAPAGSGTSFSEAKYNFLDPKKETESVSDSTIRVPTGDEDNFLGTGVLSGQIYGIGSWALGKFAPHANVGYTLSSGNVGSWRAISPTRSTHVVGFEAECHPRVTFALRHHRSLPSRRHRS